MLPLTRAPTQWSPISEWIAYAKSTGVEPRGKVRTSPFGVNT